MLVPKSKPDGYIAWEDVDISKYIKAGWDVDVFTMGQKTVKIINYGHPMAKYYYNMNKEEI